jgi:hypothetical protein
MTKRMTIMNDSSTFDLVGVHKRDWYARYNTLLALFHIRDLQYLHPLHCIHSTTPSTPTATMFRCCIVRITEASPALHLQYCAACQSALYCSETCQRQDWREHHKQICKLLNVGNGSMQVRIDEHTLKSRLLKEECETQERGLDEDMKRFFKLFQESTFRGSQAAALEMRKIAERQDKTAQVFLLT